MKKFINLFIIIFIFCFISLDVIAQDVQKTGIQLVDLSFEQAYQLMLENNNSLKAYNEAIEQTKFEKRATLGEFSPKVVMSSTYLHFSSDMDLTTPVNTSFLGVPISTTTTTRIQDQNLFAMGGGIVWNVFTGGKILSNHAAARAKYEATNAKYKDVKDNLTLELVKRYYGLKLAQDVAEVHKQNVDCVSKHLNDAKLLEKQGVISKSERLHAEVAYANAKRDYDAALRDISIVEEGLKALIKAKDANLSGVRVAPNSMLFIYDDISIDLAAMKTNALKNNPQLKMLEQKKKALDAKYHANAAGFMPTVSLFATDIFAQSHLSQAVPNAAFGATANWMLFDGLKRENNFVAANHERKMVEYELEDAKYNVEALVTKQYHELMKQKENYISSVKSLTKAQESLRVADLSFKEGYGTSLQVTDAQIMLQKVKIDRLNSIYNFDVTLTDLLKTNGDTNEIFEYMNLSKKAKM